MYCAIGYALRKAVIPEKYTRIHVLQVNATAILLSNNPWNCDCFVFWSIRQYATDENIESSTCMDPERNQLRVWNDTNLSDSICEEEIRQNANKSKRERNSREDNAPDLIITIYGYVFVALSALICMCCCCDKPRRRKISSCSWQYRTRPHNYLLLKMFSDAITMTDTGLAKLSQVLARTVKNSRQSIKKEKKWVIGLPTS